MQDFSRSLSAAFPNAPKEKVQNFLSCAFALISPEASTLGLPDFPLENLPRAVRLMVGFTVTGTIHDVIQVSFQLISQFNGVFQELFPWINVHDALSRLYPKDYMLNNEGVKSVETILESFRIQPKTIGTRITNVQCSATSAVVSMGANGLQSTIQVSMDNLPTRRYNFKVISTFADVISPISRKSLHFPDTLWNSSLYRLGWFRPNCISRRFSSGIDPESCCR